MVYVRHLPYGQGVWDWYDAILPGKEGFNSQPGWAIVPPNYVPPSDVTPPSPPTNVEVISVTAHSATVRWQAPGDDGLTGTATTYDLRYSTETHYSSQLGQCNAGNRRADAIGFRVDAVHDREQPER